MQTSDLSTEKLRELADARPDEGLVLTLYLDLDPREFAIAPARQSAITSLVNEAAALADDEALDHDERTAVRNDVERARAYLEDELDPDGARGVAIFACEPAGLFETLRLARTVPTGAHLDTKPIIEPLADAADQTRWAVLVANRGSARLFRGTRDALYLVGSREDRLHGQHQQGGWSQARYERSVDEDVQSHVKATVEELERHHARRPFDALLLGGPDDVVARFEEAVGEELRAKFTGRIAVDVDSAGPDEVLEAARDVVEEHERAAQESALDRFRAGVGGGEGRAAAGWDAVLGALNEQRVEILMLDDVEGRAEGRVCPQCGFLATSGDACPVDGTALGRVDDVGEAAVEAAVRQDAGVLRLRYEEDALKPHDGVGAVLRYGR
jgi:peptide chain release factor subunit 1